MGRRRDEVGIDGEVADKLNRLVEDPHASVAITLGKLPVMVRRTGADTVAMSRSVLGQSLEMHGHLEVVAGSKRLLSRSFNQRQDQIRCCYGLRSFHFLKPLN